MDLELENPEWIERDIPTLANIRKGEEFTLYIGRENLDRGLPASKWGNPFRLKNESERKSVLKQHWEYLEDNEELIAALPELAGHVLGCYCYSTKTGHGKECHGSNLIKAYLKYVKNRVE